MVKAAHSLPVSLLVALICLSISCTVVPQEMHRDANTPLPSNSNLRFEVVSVKKSPSDERGMGLFTYPGARVVTHNMTVRALIAEAYGIDESQIVGGPSWITKSDFHIEAKPPEEVASHYVDRYDPLQDPPDEIRQMLQNLLTDRFQLRLHTEQGEGQVYELIRNNRPLRLKTAKDVRVLPWAGALGGGIPNGQGLSGRNITMPELAQWITGWLHCPVLDRTGVRGAYDFEVGSDSEETGLSLFDGVSQSLQGLGFALRKEKGPIYKVVVDGLSEPSPD